MEKRFKPTLKKVFIGSVVSLFLGTSCCWISAIAVWAGGFTLIGATCFLFKDLLSVITTSSIVLFLVVFIRFYLSLKKKVGTS